jgi:hypothetical protein
MVGNQLQICDMCEREGSVYKAITQPNFKTEVSSSKTSLIPFVHDSLCPTRRCSVAELPLVVISS